MGINIKLDGMGIFVDDMEVMVDFYKNVLGFEIEWDGKDPSVLLKKDGVLFMLYGRNNFEEMTKRKYSYAQGTNGHYEVALSVPNFDDVDTVFAEVVSKGAHFIMAPTTEPWGQRTSYIADPEGNIIEIGSFNR